jgi:hypothetical protein
MQVFNSASSLFTSFAVLLAFFVVKPNAHVRTYSKSTLRGYRQIHRHSFHHTHSPKLKSYFSSSYLPNQTHRLLNTHLHPTTTSVKKKMWRPTAEQLAYLRSDTLDSLPLFQKHHLSIIHQAATSSHRETNMLKHNITGMDRVGSIMSIGQQ